MTVLVVLSAVFYYGVVFDHSWYRLPGTAGPVSAAPGTATLTLPTLGKEAPIVFTTSTDPEVIGEDLKKGVSLSPTNARPGQAGNVFITGHSFHWPWSGPYRSIFGDLDELAKGDKIVIQGNQEFTYRVNGQRLVGPDEVWVMRNDPSSHRLTLMTCWPPGTTWKRRIVTAELVR